MVTCIVRGDVVLLSWCWSAFGVIVMWYGGDGEKCVDEVMVKMKYIVTVWIGLVDMNVCLFCEVMVKME